MHIQLENTLDSQIFEKTTSSTHSHGSVYNIQGFWPWPRRVELDRPLDTSSPVKWSGRHTESEEGLHLAA